MARILVVEDERDLQEIIAYNLRQSGHAVTVVGSGRDALTAVADARPDLLLLDLMLPDVSGIEVCRKLKGDTATREIPIIMVTAKGDEVDRVVGFELGADDYVVKPYSLRELLLRVDAVLRRTSTTSPPTQGLMVFGKLRLDRIKAIQHAFQFCLGDHETTAISLPPLWGKVARRDGRGECRRATPPFRRFATPSPTRGEG